MWELALGTLVALFLFYHPQKKEVNLLINFLGATSIVYYVYAFSNSVGNSYFAEKSLFVCLATAIFIIFVHEDTLTGKVFSFPPIRFIGKISYSLYLWHWPIIVFWNYFSYKYFFQTTIPIQICLVISAMLLATLSWKYVETPFRKIKTWNFCLRLITPYMAIAILLVSTGFTLSATEKIKLDDNFYAEASFSDVLAKKYPWLGPKGPIQFMIIGDSHARAVAYAFDDLAKQYGISGRIGSHKSTFPAPNVRRTIELYDPPYAHEWLQYIKDNNIKHIVLVGFWTVYINDSKLINTGETCTFPIIAKELHDLVKSLLEDGHEVWVVDDVPHFTRQVSLGAFLLGSNYSEPAQNEYPNFVIQALKGLHSQHLHILKPWSSLVQDNKVYLVRNGYLLYHDSNHLTRQGARAIEEVFRPMFTWIRAKKDANREASARTVS